MVMDHFMYRGKGILGRFRQSELLGLIQTTFGLHTLAFPGQLILGRELRHQIYKHALLVLFDLRGLVLLTELLVVLTMKPLRDNGYLGLAPSTAQHRC